MKEIVIIHAYPVQWPSCRLLLASLSFVWAHTCVTGTVLLTPPESSPVEAAQARWAREGLSQTVHPRSPCSAGLARESWKSLNIWILNLVHFLHLVVKSSAKKNYQRNIKCPIK